jgi:predicted transcriptional regulator
MRTTVELDPDLVARLSALARETGISFEEALNRALRAGLQGGDSRSRRRYRLPSKRLGLRSDAGLDRALFLADKLQDAETIRKHRSER